MRLVCREKPILFLSSFFLFFNLWIVYPQAQVELGEKSSEGPNFDVGFASFRSEGINLSNLLFFYRIGYPQLQFLKKRDGFLASYEISLILYDRKGRQINGQIWRDSLKVKAYEETRAEDKPFTGQKSLFVNPGSYRMEVKLTDLNTRQSLQQERKVVIPSFRGAGWIVSDLVLADSVSTSRGHFALKRGEYGIVPNAGGIFNDQEPHLCLYYEVYGLPLGSVIVEVYQIRDRKGAILTSDSLKTEVREDPSRRVHRFAISDLEPGRYEVEVRLKAPSYGEKKLQSEFQMHWKDTAPSAKDYPTAVEQLRYIATPQELKRLKKSPPGERRKLLKDFWKRRDPTPGTPKNELEEEYYRRVGYSDAHFGGMEGGWRSDRGRVYIIYGRPDEVERHPFETETVSYQIWYYLDKKLTFIFVDRHGFGDYELVSPLYPQYR